MPPPAVQISGRGFWHEHWTVLRFYWPRLLVTCLGWVANDFAVRPAGHCLACAGGWQQYPHRWGRHFRLARLQLPARAGLRPVHVTCGMPCRDVETCVGMLKLKAHKPPPPPAVLWKQALPVAIHQRHLTRGLPLRANAVDPAEQRNRAAGM